VSKETTSIVLEVISIIVGLFIWVLCVFFWEWYILGGALGFIVGLFVAVTLSWIGEKTGYWPYIDPEDFKLYGWIPLWFW
jgi:hypothetical protein